MAETKYGKYIITELKSNIQVPDFRPDKPGQDADSGMQHIIWLDKEVIQGAKIYSECVWFWPNQPRKSSNEDDGALKTHTHPVDEVIAFFGTNIDNPHDLGGEIELWLEGEQHVITQSFLAYVPAGMKHCPLIIRKIERPIFHFTIGPGEYQ